MARKSVCIGSRRVCLEARACGTDRAGQSRAGKLAARDAVRALHPCSEVTIESAPTGEPRVLGEAQDVRVSISHARGLAVGVATRGAAIGVDLCEWERAPLIRRLAPRFLRAELAAGAEEWPDREWVRAWAVREAKLKAMGLGLVEGGVLDGEDPLADIAGFHVRCLEFDEGVVAIAMREC